MENSLDLDSRLGRSVHRFLVHLRERLEQCLAVGSDDPHDALHF